MDYAGLYRDLLAMRQRAHSDSRWCEVGGKWKQLAYFIDEVDLFLADLVSSGVN